MENMVNMDKEVMTQGVDSYIKEKERYDGMVARINVRQAIGKNSDYEADLQRFSKRTGLPVETIRNNEKEAKYLNLPTSRIDDSPALRKFLNDPGNADIAYDDIDILGKLNTIAKAVKDTGKAAYKGLSRGSADIVFGAPAWVFGATGELLDTPTRFIFGDNPLKRAEAGLLGLQESVYRATDYDLPTHGVAADIYAGVESVGRMVPSIVGGAAGLIRGGTSIVQGKIVHGGFNLAKGGAVMGTSTFGGEYKQAREAGLSALDSTPYAASQAAIEVATERLPAVVLLKNLKQGAPLYKTLINQLAAEIPSEQLATVLQDLNEWAVLNPQKTMGEYLAERPERAVSTLISTITATAIMGTAGHGISRLANRQARKEEKAAQAEQDAKVIQEGTELTKESLLHKRAPEQFQVYLQEVFSTTEIEDVYVDANVLYQTGMIEELAQVSPSIKEQFELAAETGQDVRIPIDEYLTYVAPTQAANSLLEHIKLHPEGMTVAEAKEYLPQAQQELIKEFEQEQAEIAKLEAFEESANQVEQKILDQLVSTGVYSDEVSQSQVQIAKSWYSTMAQRLGTTPEAVFDLYPMHITRDGAVAATAQENLTGRDLFQLDEAINSAFAQAVDEVSVGNINGGYINLGTTPTVLKMLGLPDVSINTSYEVLKKVMGGKHNVTAEVLKQLPTQLNNPVAVMKSHTKQNAYVVLTELIERENGVDKPIIAALHLKKTKSGFELINVASVYGRSKSQIKKGLENDLLYWNNEKGLPLLNALGLQLPSQMRSEITPVISDIKTEKDLSQYQSSFLQQGDVLSPQQSYQQAVKEGKTELSFEQWQQVRTPEFKAWFGDWENDPENASKVINPKTGEPLVVYHYTDEQFTQFELSKARQGSEVPAFFFTTDPEMGMEYGENEMQVFLNIRNPVEKPSITSEKDGRALRAEIESQGYDGTIVDDSYDDVLSIEYAALNANQIKSATGNKGTFDVNNNNIYYQKQIDQLEQTIVKKYESEIQDGIYNSVRDELFDEYESDGTIEGELIAEVAEEELGLERDDDGEFVDDDAYNQIESYARDLIEQIAKERSNVEINNFDDVDTYGTMDIAFNISKEYLTAKSIPFEEPYSSGSRYLLVAQKDNNTLADEIEEIDDFDDFDSDVEAIKLRFSDHENQSRLHTHTEHNWVEGESVTELGYMLYAAEKYYHGEKGLGEKVHFSKGNQVVKGTFSPNSNTISLYAKADFSTFAHEQGHFYLENMFKMTGQLLQQQGFMGKDNMSPGELSIIQDTENILQWFGIQGGLQEWYSLDFDEQRSYHEQFARGFEAYLFEGKSPNIELSSVFSRFSAWLKAIYKQLTNLNVTLSPEIRGVMDRMLATDEQILAAEYARGMIPLFETAEQAGMTEAEFMQYQALGKQATEQAQAELGQKSINSLKWLRGARSKKLKALQREARHLRNELTIDARTQLMREPVYRAWKYLTQKPMDEDELQGRNPKAPKRNTKTVDPRQDTLFEAIAKLGGLKRDELVNMWGMEPKEKIPNPFFNKRVLDDTNGLSIDEMRSRLQEYGYLSNLDATDYNWDPNEFEEKFFDALRGDPGYSYFYDEEYANYTGELTAYEVAQTTSGKLSRAEIEVQYGKDSDIYKKLDKYHMLLNDGISSELVAELHGFDSGDALVQALFAAQDPVAAVDALVDDMMVKNHSEFATAEAIESAADAAVHNQLRAKMVAAELGALEKANKPASQPNLIVKAAKELANNLVQQRKVRDLKPGQFIHAESKAAKLSAQELKAGNLAKAAAFKRNQLINSSIVKAIYNEQEYVAKSLRYLKKFTSEGTRKNIDMDYLEQIDYLLDKLDLRKGVSLKRIDKNQSLSDWVQAQQALGYQPNIDPDRLNEISKTHYKNMTLEEFKALVDGIKTIDHQGRLKKRLLLARDKRAFELIRDEAVQSIHDNAGDRVANTRTPSGTWARWFASVKAFGQAHIKIATMMRIMDGGKDNGPLWNLFIRTANERQNWKTKRQAEMTKALHDIVKPILKNANNKKIYIDEIQKSLTKSQIFAVGLNMGNEGNLQRLLSGEEWNLAQLNAVTQHLTKEDWNAIQSIWDMFESLRPEVAEKEKRLTGKEPQWVEATQVVTPYGVYRGGYFPIKYDPDGSKAAAEHADADAAKQMIAGAYAKTTTKRGFVKARVQNVKDRPLLLDMSVVYSGLSDVLHDLTWHEWLIDTNRLLGDAKLDKAIRERYGPNVIRNIKKWQQDIAASDATAAADSAANFLRRGVSAASLGFSFWTAAQQPVGLTQSVVRVGEKWISKSAMNYIANPIKMTQDVRQLSDFMNNRSITYLREMNELNSIASKPSAMKEFIRRYAYSMMMFSQGIVDVITWNGAYEKALAQGYDPDTAVALSDQAVIDAQGGGEVKDLSAIERGGGVQKLFTVFYSFFNTQLNLAYANHMSPRTVIEKVKNYGWIYLVPAVVIVMLKSSLTPGDDDEDLLNKMVKEFLGQLFNQMAFVREFQGLVDIVADDKHFDYAGPAGLRMVKALEGVGKQIKQGEFDAGLAKSVVDLGGAFYGIPSVQINRTWKGAQAMAEGKTINPLALFFGYEGRLK